MSDDGSERDLREWLDREVFGSRGHMDVVSESDGGRGLVADYRNDAWGSMGTKWLFTVDGGKVSRLETGQAQGQLPLTSAGGGVATHQLRRAGRSREEAPPWSHAVWRPWRGVVVSGAVHDRRVSFSRR